MREFSGSWIRHSGDIWGGLAAMLVALPASVAFGVTVYSAISPEYAAFGALAGVLGATVLGLVAPIFGGTDRLISAPCAPAAAVLTAFAIDLVQQGTAPTTIVLLMTVLGLLTGVIQLLIGALGLGKLIRYIPYPVASGYLSGVALLIIGSQLPNFLGAAKGSFWLAALLNPDTWDWRALVIGMTTVVTTLYVPKLTRAIPATIVGIVAGVLSYLALASDDPRLFELPGNSLVIGAIGANSSGYFGLITDRWLQIGELKLAQIASLAVSALTLAALLCIDTLKTCVVLDQLTATRHQPNRELIAQGLANFFASAAGGLPGAGTMGASMVNLNSGAKTRISGIIEGVFTLLVAVVLGAFIAWIPIAALSGVLIIIGFRMIDTDPLRFLESRATVLDFIVVLAVIGVTLSVGLIAASVVGVVLSVILFLREQVGGNIVRRKSFLSQRSSTWYRSEAETRTLEQKGNSAVVFELQGSLFFGTAYQLYRTLEPELRLRDFVIIDMQRVQSLDITAAHMLNLVRDTLHERGVPLLLSNVRESLPNGRNLREFLDLTRLTAPKVMKDGKNSNVRFFTTLESAIKWVEDRLVDAPPEQAQSNLPPLELYEMALFQGRKDSMLNTLEACMEKRSWKAGSKIYARNDNGDELYLIRSGEVRILGNIGGGQELHHIATFGRGEFFGGLAFLDRRPRGNDAVVYQDAEMFVLTLTQFKRLAEEHKRLAFILLSDIARTLAIRLRHADGELTLLHDD
ncbi:MAG: SLC26A/SulP transporter family protein [Pseudomonadota bacterium]